jgi:hypothetical protein
MLGGVTMILAGRPGSWNEASPTTVRLYPGPVPWWIQGTGLLFCRGKFVAGIARLLPSIMKLDGTSW